MADPLMSRSIVPSRCAGLEPVPICARDNGGLVAACAQYWWEKTTLASIGTVPFGNLKFNIGHRYWELPFIVNVPIENGDLTHSYVRLPEGKQIDLTKRLGWLPLRQATGKVTAHWRAGEHKSTCRFGIRDFFGLAAPWRSLKFIQ